MQKIRLFHHFLLELQLIQKSCNLIGREHFGPYLRNQIFAKYGICAGTQQLIENFFIDQIQKKLKTKFSNKFKKPYFWSIFPVFGAKNFFPKNPVLSRTTPYGPLTPCLVSGKTNEMEGKLLRKLRDGRTEGRKDGQPRIHKTLPATVRGLKEPNFSIKLRLKLTQSEVKQVCLSSCAYII